METILTENEVVINKISQLRSNLIKMNMESNGTIDSGDIIKDIYKLDEISKELKELLVLLHTNNITLNKFNHESLVVGYDEVLELSNTILNKQNKLIKVLLDEKKNEAEQNTFKNKIKNAMLNPLTIGVVSILGFMFLFILAEKIFPKEVQDLLGVATKSMGGS